MGLLVQIVNQFLRMSSEVLALHKKVGIYFGIKCFYSIPQHNEKGKYWLLTGGRKGHVGIWQLTEEDNGISLQLGKELIPRKEIQGEVVIKFLPTPEDWSCWNPETIKDGFKELIVLLVGRRKLHQGCSFFSLQINIQNGKTKLDSKKFYHLNGVRTLS